MSDEVATYRLRPREAGAAASAASHSCGVEQQLMRHVSKDNRGREFEKTVCFGHFGAKWCIAGGASSLDDSPNFISRQFLRLLSDPRHNAPHPKNRKNGAFWCILVHDLWKRFRPCTTGGGRTQALGDPGFPALHSRGLAEKTQKVMQNDAF